MRRSAYSSFPASKLYLQVSDVRSLRVKQFRNDILPFPVPLIEFLHNLLTRQIRLPTWHGIGVRLEIRVLIRGRVHRFHGRHGTLTAPQRRRRPGRALREPHCFTPCPTFFPIVFVSVQVRGVGLFCGLSGPCGGLPPRRDSHRLMVGEEIGVPSARSGDRPSANLRPKELSGRLFPPSRLSELEGGAESSLSS